MAPKRALLSVSDKSGLVAFARGLSALGVKLLSTGGTHRTLVEADIPVETVELHRLPRGHGRPRILRAFWRALAARKRRADRRLGAELIDLAVNSTRSKNARKPGASFAG
jgi:hypothetical protein